MNFLFAMFQGGGNIPLIVPIAARLVARGHQVRVLAGPGIRVDRLPVSEGFLQRLTAAGVEVVPFRNPNPHPLETLPPLRGLVGGWIPPRLMRIALPGRNNLWAPCWAENVFAEAVRSRPDAVVADYFLLGALAAAEAAEIASVTLVHNVPPPLATGMPPRSQGFLPPRSLLEAFEHRVWNWATGRISTRNGLPPLNQARSQLGLAPLKSPAEQYARSARVLMLVSEFFDFPAKQLPVNVRYVGTPIDDAAALGSWHSPWPPEDSRPLLLVSLSTLAQRQAPVMTRILQAVDGLPLRVLVTLGPNLAKDSFQVPSNVILEPFVPHSAVLPHTAAVVSQCGLGTLAKTLENGLPVLCIPLIGDQPDNAARVVARGAGIRLEADASVPAIRTAIMRIVGEPAYREAAQKLGRLMSAQDATEKAALEIESVAAGAIGAIPV